MTVAQARGGVGEVVGGGWVVKVGHGTARWNMGGKAGSSHPDASGLNQS